MTYARRSYPLSRLVRFALFALARILPMSGYLCLKFYRLADVDFAYGGYNNGRCGVVRFDTMHPEDIHIGADCEIVDGYVILSHFYDTADISRHAHFRGEVHIGRHVYLGANVLIVKPVTIGDCAVVGAGSVVNKDIPAHEVWAGVPVRFIKKRERRKMTLDRNCGMR